MAQTLGFILGVNPVGLGASNSRAAASGSRINMCVLIAYETNLACAGRRVSTDGFSPLGYSVFGLWLCLYFFLFLCFVWGVLFVLPVMGFCGFLGKWRFGFVLFIKVGFFPGWFVYFKE